jgi:ubiquinone biosynthesis protein
MLIIKNTLLLIKSIYIILIESIKYKLKITNQVETFNNITNKLSNLNILYTKLLQWIINDTIYFNDDIKKNFEKFTDNVEYNENDIDYLSLLELVNTHNIKLLSLKPIKSGTISVIFKGLLNDDKPVIIKIIKKNIQTKLIESIEFFRLLGNISKYMPYISQFNLDTLIRDNSKELLLQTNFINEVENIETFYNNFKNNTSIVIPMVYKNITSSNNNIIVMDYIDGISAYSIKHNEKDIYSRILYKFIFESIFQHEIFHGDLHPGNILFIKDNDKYKIGIVDYGIIGKINSDIKQNICVFFKRLIEKKYESVFNIIVDKLTEPIDNINTLQNCSKDKMINSLINMQKKYDILSSSIKANDIYYMNKALKKYNLILSVDFSKLFLFISSMYSLIFIIRHNIEDGLFETVFNEYCNTHIFTYFYFME